MKNKVSTSPHATLVVIFTNSDPWGNEGSALSEPPGDEELDHIQTPAIQPTPNNDKIGDWDEERVTPVICPALNDDEIGNWDDDDKN